LNGYNPEIFSTQPFFQAAHEEKLTLVYLGSFHEGKRVENLVAAMDFLPSTVHLRVIGGVPEKNFDALRKLAAGVRDGSERITFTGALPQKDAAAACAGAHIFVIPQNERRIFFSS
jgi:glycosyltransferase involved in cell wall biosynthesis